MRAACLLVADSIQVLGQLADSVGAALSGECCVIAAQVVSSAGKIGFLSNDPEVFKLFSLIYSDAYAWDHAMAKGKSFESERSRLPRQDPSVFFNGSRGEWISYHGPDQWLIERFEREASEGGVADASRGHSLGDIAGLSVSALFQEVVRLLPHTSAISIFSKFMDCPLFVVERSAGENLKARLDAACKSVGFAYESLSDESELPIR